jgi:small-conductance mechanosensitive channel
MLQWLIFAAVFYVLALYVVGERPQLQTLCWKLGNLTVASFVGYWIDRRAFQFSRIDAGSNPLLQVRRAIIIAAAMLTVGLGL